MDRKTYNRKAKALIATLLAVASPAVVSHAADYFWSGGTGTYNNAAAWGGKVPGTNDLAFNDTGTNNVVQINAGDPDWNVNGIRAGSVAAGGFEQNGQALNISNTVSGIRLGIADGSTGLFTLNNGTINYGSGQFNIGELGTGILNVNDGTITGSGNFFVNLGSSTAAVTASMDGGEAATGFTWFEQGFDAADATRGLPPAGSTFTSAAQTDHSYTLAPSFSVNDSVMVNTSAGATMTLVSPAAYSGLSFLGSAGHGPMTVNYTVHHSDSTTETGSFTVLDWFNNSGTIAYRTGGRVHADGTSLETHGVATNDTPYLFSIDINVSSASPVASIDLSCDTGDGTVCLLALSGSAGGDFGPVAIAGYNEDMIVEADAIPVVSGSVTDTFTQTGGNLDITGGGQFIVGNIGVGVYNLSGGTNTVHNYIAFGRSGGNGTVNMTGGELNQAGGGNLLVGTGFQSPASGSPVGVLNQSGGVINSQGQFLVPENSPATGTYNLSGTGILNVNNWIAIGRDNGEGTVNISGGIITKTGDNTSHFTIGSGGTGTLTQTGGVITNTVSDFWLGQTADGIWNLNGGSAILSVLDICEEAGVTGTLNLNGGDLTAQEITSGNIGSFSLINLNGGIIHASADNENFLHDVTQVFVAPGGAIFDSQDFNITIPQSLLDNGGGLTKVGSGTLNLTGFNSYSGPTFVNEGTLVESTTTTAFGDRTIADNATYGIQVQSSGGQISPANLTVGDSTGASLDFQFGSLGNPTVAPLNVSGTFTVNGTVTINITGAAPQVGSFPLVQYGTRAGSGNFVIGSLPVGTTAEIVTNASGNSIDLNFTSVDLPRWDGQVNGNWDIGVTENWINTGTGLGTVYNEGDSVLFDDNASGTTDVNMAAAVHPGGVRVNNSSLNYTLSGSGKISGSTSLIKQGSGSLAIGAANDFTGPTVIQGGNVTVSNLANGGLPSAIGASSADPSSLVLAGGALTYAGLATSINRGYSVQGDQGAINAESNLTLSGLVTASGTNGFVKGGDATLAYATVGNNVLSGADSSGYVVQAGTVVFDGSGGTQTNTVQGTRLGVDGVAANATVVLTNTTVVTTGNVDLGNVPDTTGTLVVSSNSTLNIGGWLIFGDGTGSVGTLTQNGGTINLNGGRLLMGGSPGTMGTLNINGGVFNKTGDIFDIGDGNWNGSGSRTGIVNQAGGTVNSGSEIWVGQSSTGVGIYNMSGGLLESQNWFAIGRGSSVGSLTMTGGTLNKGGNGQFIIGTSAGNNSTTSIGVLNQSGGVINCTNEYWVGENALDIGTNNISGTAVVNWYNWVSIGRHGMGVINFSGGTINRSGNGSAIVVGDNVGGGGNGFFNQSGGTLTSANQLWIGNGSGATGRYDLSGGSVTVNNWIAVGRAGAISGTLNISGGSMTKTGDNGNHLTIGSGGPGIINQTGGTITSVLSTTFIGENQSATWNLDNGTAVLGEVRLPEGGGVVAALNLNGGSMTATGIVCTNATGQGTLNFNGGTLIAGDSNTNFMHGLIAANVLAGGAVIDSGANSISISQPLLDGTGGGGLTKLGSGTLNLNGVNTYTGQTLVNAGTFGGNGTIAGPVSIASGATIAPGVFVGTLTINNTLNLSAGSTTVVEATADGGTISNDLVTGLTGVTYGGSLVVKSVGTNALSGNYVLKLFNSTVAGSGNFDSITVLPKGTGTFNPATGELTVTFVPKPVLNPPTRSGNSVILSGTGAPGTGYTVLSSTNLALPLSSWVTNTAGTISESGTFTNTISIGSEPARFFLLRQP